MPPFSEQPAAGIVLGLVIVFYLPLFGRRVLAFLRDLHEYRADRRKRGTGH